MGASLSFGFPDRRALTNGGVNPQKGTYCREVLSTPRHSRNLRPPILIGYSGSRGEDPCSGRPL
jgi:hypothetical protein